LQRFPQHDFMCGVNAFTVRLCACGALLFAAASAARAEPVDLTKRYPAGTAPIVQNKTGDKNAVPMFAGAGKKAAIAKKATITQADKKRKVSVEKNTASNKLDPQTVGAKKLSMQQFNKYAYRRNHGVRPGVPVTKAAGGEAVDKK
jgi:hypothetical protein